jgi:hypothetical protein
MPASLPLGEPSLFGFTIRGTASLQFLRDGGGEETLEVVEVDTSPEHPEGVPLGEWRLQGTTYPARAAVYRVEGGYLYWASDAGRFLVDLDHGRIEVPAGGDAILREQRLNGMPMLLSFARRGDFSLHAAAVQVGSSAVILAAPSRFGKTTLAFGFHLAGHRILSEDLVCCRPGTFEVLPGPSLVRLRPDVYGGSPPEGMRVVSERPDRVILALEGERRGDSRPVRIGGIAFLREGDDARIEEADAVDSLRDLWHLGFRMPTVEGRAGSFRLLAQLAGGVPVWNVYRPLRLSEIAETVALIADSLGS